MLLKKTKLVGFKSFVDPTTMEFKGRLVGIVGPNGCGKSNIIDAIRWVMGESSAKNLRGESMSDVIFNGSETRKPVGVASVELIFDNSEGRAAGEYATYAEISVKREVSREGQSNYYLNSTKCRRRDITDLFLGTGLGPRSYSIIEQGMISRVIEAKPEDLRNFIDEAAGVSLYKKRRHDTELRMRHTEENLLRLEDLRQEQVKLIEKLNRQAKAAEKYHAYKEELTLCEQQLQALKWQQFNTDIESLHKQVQEHNVSIEATLAKRTSCEKDIEVVRIAFTEQTDVFNEVQAQYYQIGSEISKVEQSIQHQQQRQQQIQTDLTEVTEQLQLSDSQITQDQATLTSCNDKLAEIEPIYQQNESIAETMESELLDAEAQLEESMAAWETFQQQAEQPQRIAEVERARIEQLDAQIQRIQARQIKLNTENTLIEKSELPIEAEALAEKKQQVAIQAETLEEKLEQQSEQIDHTQTEIDESKHGLATTQEQLQVQKGRQASLEALQQAALNQDEGMQDWLQSHQLENNKRLAEQIQVSPGYETAIEVVLGNYLDTICVDDFSNQLETLIQGSAELKHNVSMIGAEQTPSEHYAENKLASKVMTQLPIYQLLNDVYVVETDQQALDMIANLQPQESVVTKSGIWMGINWVRLHANQQTSGVLEREQQLQTIAENLSELETQQQQQQEILGIKQQQLHDLEAEKRTLSHEYKQLSDQLSELSSQYGAIKAKVDGLKHSKQRIGDELHELQNQLTTAETAVTESRVKLSHAIEEMAVTSEKQSQLQEAKDSDQLRAKQANQALKQHRADYHAMALDRQRCLTQQQALKESMSRLNEQQKSLLTRQDQLNQQLEEVTAPEVGLKEELDRLLDSRSEIDHELQQARAKRDELDHQVNELEQTRRNTEEEIQALRSNLEEVKMSWQSLKVKREVVDEFFTKAEVDVQQVLANTPEHAEETAWQENLDTLTKRIDRLGPINLAAIEELKVETDKQRYLDSQFDDLTEALETLTEAIKKIDKETRTRFKETFETVNAHFKKLFPKLFGGGQAYLELVGEDMLEAGVAVMARPPGKRNSSIHLLSGGEKALTAVSLVFSIFQLNPAPFCVLDEVDAPLDDANVGRYCQMLQELQQSVQFIFITHNKITMEIANQLAGVTMKEPGVSRLVTVDIDEAVEMATA